MHGHERIPAVGSTDDVDRRRQAPGRADALLALQSTAGNRAVGRLVAGRTLQRVVGPRLAIGTQVWIKVADPRRKVRGRTTSAYDLATNTYEVLEDDTGAGVFPPAPRRESVHQLDPLDEDLEPPTGELPRSSTRSLTVAVIGAGPTGLLAAIEAVLSGATRVTIFEAREADYSRRNVPTLTKHTLAKLRRAGVYEALFEESGSPGTLNSDGAGQVPLRNLEEALAARARELGVAIVRGVKPTGIEGSPEKRGLRPASATLQFPHERVRADLVIVATGAGASRDPFVTSTLGFGYRQLTATDYGLYGLFEHPSTSAWELDYYLRAFRRWMGWIPARTEEKAEHRSGVRALVETGPTLTGFETPGHDYILGFLSGLSPDDYAHLQIRADDPEEVKERKRKDLRRLAGHIATRMTSGLGEKFEVLLEDPKAVELFEVKLAQALNVVSPRYPAVLVGDAAATPHPQTGSGLNTGAGSLDAIGKLVQDLLAGDSPDEAFAGYQSFVGSLTTVMVLKALFAMATAFEFKVKQLIPPQAQRSFNRFFKRVHGVEWTSWFQTRITLAKDVINLARENEEHGVPDYRALDVAWTCLDEIYEAIRATFQGNATIGERLDVLDAAK